MGGMLLPMQIHFWVQIYEYEWNKVHLAISNLKPIECFSMLNVIGLSDSENVTSFRFHKLKYLQKVLASCKYDDVKTKISLS